LSLRFSQKQTKQVLLASSKSNLENFSALRAKAEADRAAAQNLALPSIEGEIEQAEPKAKLAVKKMPKPKVSASDAVPASGTVTDCSGQGRRQAEAKYAGTLKDFEHWISQELYNSDSSDDDVERREGTAEQLEAALQPRWGPTPPVFVKQMNKETGEEETIETWPDNTPQFIKDAYDRHKNMLESGLTIEQAIQAYHQTEHLNKAKELQERCNMKERQRLNWNEMIQKAPNRDNQGNVLETVRFPITKNLQDTVFDFNQKVEAMSKAEVGIRRKEANLPRHLLSTKSSGNLR
jgi:hypothetical protein